MIFHRAVRVLEFSPSYTVTTGCFSLLKFLSPAGGLNSVRSRTERRVCVWDKVRFHRELHGWCPGHRGTTQVVLFSRAKSGQRGNMSLPFGTVSRLQNTASHHAPEARVCRRPLLFNAPNTHSGISLGFWLVEGSFSSATSY